LIVLSGALWLVSSFALGLGLARPIVEISVDVKTVLKNAIDRQPIIGLLLKEKGFDLGQMADKLPPSSSTRQSILSSVAELYRVGSLTAATIVLLFSVITPIVKQLVLLIVLLGGGRRAKPAFRLVQHLHKWAMVDVFVLAMVSRELRLASVPGREAVPEPMLSLRVRGGLPMTVAPAPVRVTA